MKRIISTVLAVAAVQILGNSAFAAGYNYTNLYNSVNSAYQTLSSASSNHDSYVKGKSNCSGEASKWWAKSVAGAVKTAANIQKKLNKHYSANHGKKIFRDLLKTAKDLKSYGSAVKSKMGKCISTPKKSQTAENDLNNDANDLGLQHGY